MKKTFRKVIASMLAVLMIVSAMPFTVFAAQDSRKWWEEDGVALDSITEEPTYWGYNSPEDPVHQEYGPWGLSFGAAVNIDDEHEDHRDDYKPILGIIVSGIGQAGVDCKNDKEGLAALQAVYNKNYAITTDRDYDTCMADGTILNPADLKAGQRIAITFEVGGFDALSNGQIKGTYDPNYLTPGYYGAMPSGRGDQWKVATGSTATAWQDATNLNAYGSAVKFAGYNTNTETNVFYSAFFGGFFGNGDLIKSNFLGTGLADEIGARPFGKFGITVGTVMFEVQQDCDLKDVLFFADDYIGTCIDPYYESCATVNKQQMRFTMAEVPGVSCAVIAPVYANYSAGSTECDHANTTSKTEVTTAATCEAKGVETVTVTCNDCGEVVSTTTNEIPALGHKYEGALTPAGTTQHTVACINGCGTTETVDCTFTVVEHKDATVTEAGYDKYACACGNSYTEEIPVLTCEHKNTTESKETTKAATCTETGIEVVTVTCNDCGKVVSTTENTIPMIPHTEKVVPGKAATCTETGLTDGKVCEVCGTVIVAQEEIPMIAHTEKVVPGKAATCTSTGLTDGKVCEVCGTVIVAQEEIPMKAHTEVEIPAVAATCTEGGKTAGVKCSVCGTIITAPQDTDKLGHDFTVEVPGSAVAPTVDAPGKEADMKCSRCDAVQTGAVIPALASYEITVVATDLGTVTLNGADVTDGATVKVEAGSTVTLTAEAAEGSKFLGWTANGLTTVSTDTTFTTVALANVTYTPVFEKADAASFTVVFADAYGNIVSSQVVTDASQLVIPAAPARSGYVAATENGWSMTDAEIKALTSSATVIALYELAETEGYTVTATGATITGDGIEATADVVTGVAYDTLVTVYKEGAKGWSVNGVTVAYGDTYSFYVGKDIEVVAVMDGVTAVPMVANVGVNEIGNAGALQAQFIATRTMADGYTYIDSGFVYGKGDLGEITLFDVDGSAVKAAYTKTASEQFSVTYGLRAQSGTITARAFIAYANADGEVTVTYAAPMTYQYK